MATFKEAYDWMARVHKTCLETPVSVHFDYNYCKCLDSRSLTLFVHYNDEVFSVDWSTYTEDDKYEMQKKVVLALLHGVGITLYPKKNARRNC